MDKINVIVPCYNYSNYLDLCLMSIFSQRTSCIVEIILSDDNSTDESFGIAERIAKNYNTEKIYLKNFVHKKNIGELENTKFLLSKCDGKYIAYLDADDYWIDPYKLEKQYSFMEKNPQFSMCYTGQLGFDGLTHHPNPTGFDSLISPGYFISTGQIYYDIYDHPYGTIDTSVISNANHIFSSSRFFRNYKDIFQDYFYEFPYSDWPMNFELSLRGMIHYMNYASYVYRLKLDSLFHSETSTERESKLQHRKQLLKSLHTQHLINKK